MIDAKIIFYYYQYLNYFYENNDVNNLNYKEHQETFQIGLDGQTLNTVLKKEKY